MIDILKEVIAALIPTLVIYALASAYGERIEWIQGMLFFWLIMIYNKKEDKEK